MTAVLTHRWVTVCARDDLLRERGMAALVDGMQVALFRTYDDEVYALGNQDPISGAYVLARGIVGTRGSVPTVASPMHKQIFELPTGRCLGEPALRVPTYPTRCRRGLVEVDVGSPG